MAVQDTVPKSKHLQDLNTYVIGGWPSSRIDVKQGYDPIGDKLGMIQ